MTPLSSIRRLLAGAALAVLAGPAFAGEAPAIVSFRASPSVADLEALFGLAPARRTVPYRIVLAGNGARVDVPATDLPPPAAKPAPSAPAVKPVQKPAAAPTRPAAAPARPAPAAAPQPSRPAKTAVSSEPMPSVWVTERIRFANNSDRIVSSEYGIVDTIGALLLAHPGTRMVVSGHANATGPSAWNEQLSQRRAAAVRAHLIRQYAIGPERLVVRAAGDREPLPGTRPEAGVNRRVQFGLLKG